MNNINHFPCIPLTVPPWRKYCSTVEKISFHHEMSSGLTTALEFLMSAEIAKTFLLQNLESVVPLAATFALRAMMSLMLHWEMQGGHRSGHKKAENDTEAEKND